MKLRNFGLAIALALTLVAAPAAQTTSTPLQLVGQIQSLLDQLKAALQPAPPPPPPTAVHVSTAAGLQPALDAAVDNTTILVGPGTYSVNLVLRAGRTNVTLRSDVADSVLGVGRVNGPALAGKLAHFVPLDGFSPVISTDPGAHDYHIRGIEVSNSPSVNDRSLVLFGDSAQTVLGSIPYNLTVDQSYIHAGPAGALRGIELQSASTTVSNSDVRGFLYAGRDSQAIVGWAGPGPYAILNNYIEASGENLMFGGADPLISGLVPSDITIQGNYFFKPLAWKSNPGSVKNLFELKNAQRVLVENNLFENCWPDAQSGHGIQFTVRNQDGSAPWSTVANVTFRYNVVKNVAGFMINILGLDDQGWASVQAVNLFVQNNLGIKIGDGGLQMTSGFNPTVVDHNTILGSGGRFLSIASTSLGQSFTNNVVDGGAYGITGDGQMAVGLDSLAEMAPGYVFKANVINGNVERTITYPTGNYPLGAGALAPLLDSQFRYIGTATSSDSAPLGADISGLLKRITTLSLP